MRLLFSVLSIFVLFPYLALSGGCSWFNDDEGVFVNKSDDYLDARERSGLVIPADLNQDRVGDPFPIPPTPTQLNPEFYPQRPPQPSAIYANDNRDVVRIQSLGERRWLALPESPSTVWPKVKQFLAENGVPVAGESGVTACVGPTAATLRRGMRANSHCSSACGEVCSSINSRKLSSTSNSRRMPIAT